MFDITKPLPELLCPAGSEAALDAAIEGGADAVYLGGTAFNARMNAHNFGGDALRSAVLRAHAYGVKIYLTLNTLVCDRELPEFLKAATDAAEAGVDALIVADLGGAAAIHRVLPTMELHASTQMSGHNAMMAQKLAELGFTRMVIARETSAKDLKSTIQNAPIEIEAFIHGALCVSHSGQCLFSSLVGGRSGNRGECAQPCRLPYACPNHRSKKEFYPLSLKDLSLAAHVPYLIDAGVSSLKIEGRMKSPEYVRDTARIWRTLLDERRAATPTEMRALADIFSRGGFTDAYHTKSISHAMLGIRSENDKSNSRALEPFTELTRKIPLCFAAKLEKNKPISLTLSDANRTITVMGDVPFTALNAPLSREVVERNLTKLGGTSYAVQSFTLSLGDGLMLPISKLNDLRRRAIEAWEASISFSEFHMPRPYEARTLDSVREPTLCTARFYSPEQITPLAKRFFQRRYLPLGKESAACNGVIIPPVVFDSDLKRVQAMLVTAAQSNMKYAMVGNVGHIALAKNVGLSPMGDFRLNATNTETVGALQDMGIQTVLLSPELTLPQARDIGGDTALTVYGRIPLMTLEKCVIKEIADCKRCQENNVCLRDRKGIEFPVLREWEHRNVIYNSLPTNMSDRQEALDRAHIRVRHFIFTIESPEEVDKVIGAYLEHDALPFPVRRLS